ncbi:hypothetical protein AHF37_10305 [Paragonimus kellicotti]|nr:hypothetical protein AHF37_10305 [Paragonimus kellicotti]
MCAHVHSLTQIQPMRPPGTNPSRLEETRQSPLDILQWRWTGAVNVNNQRRMDFEYEKRQSNRSNRLASDLSAGINIHRPYRSMRLPPILDRSNRQVTTTAKIGSTFNRTSQASSTTRSRSSSFARETAFQRSSDRVKTAGQDKTLHSY